MWHLEFQTLSLGTLGFFNMESRLPNHRKVHHSFYLFWWIFTCHKFKECKIFLQRASEIDNDKIQSEEFYFDGPYSVMSLLHTYHMY